MANTSGFRCLSLLGLVGALGGCSGPEAPGESPEATGQVERPAIVSTITEGDYVIRSVMTNKCIDVASSSTADGAKVQQWDCNGTNAQKFHVAPTTNGYFKIINVNSGKGLDVQGVSTAQNAIIHQWSYVGGANQQFRAVSLGNGFHRIEARHSGKVLDVANCWSSGDGTAVQQWVWSNNDCQQFRLEAL